MALRINNKFKKHMIIGLYRWLKSYVRMKIYYLIKLNNKINGRCEEEKVYYKNSQHS